MEMPTYLGWQMVMAMLTLWMVPGVAFMNSGLILRSSAVSMLLLPAMTVAVTIILWYFFGHSLAFSTTGSRFIGDFRNALLRGADDTSSEHTFLREAVLASTAVTIVTGSTTQRGRILPCVLALSFWMTFAYIPVARWTLSANGWANRMGAVDFAGGVAVHVSAGCAALAYSLMLGPRKEKLTEHDNRPHNVILVGLGTVLFWAGSFGALGSALTSPTLFSVVLVNAVLAICTSGLAWTVVDYYHTGRWSFLSFSTGGIAGVILITSGAGFVRPWAAIIIGIFGGLLCNASTTLKWILHCDDPFDILALHGIGGILGDLLTAIFATNSVIKLDSSIPLDPNGTGWVDHHWIQLGYNAAATTVSAVYSFVAMFLILWLLHAIANWVPALDIRAPAEAFEQGIDEAYIGDLAYDYHYCDDSEDSIPDNKNPVPKNERPGPARSVDSQSQLIEHSAPNVFTTYEMTSWRSDISRIDSGMTD